MAMQQNIKDSLKRQLDKLYLPNGYLPKASKQMDDTIQVLFKYCKPRESIDPMQYGVQHISLLLAYKLNEFGEFIELLKRVLNAAERANSLLTTLWKGESDYEKDEAVGNMQVFTKENLVALDEINKVDLSEVPVDLMQEVIKQTQSTPMALLSQEGRGDRPDDSEVVPCMECGKPTTHGEMDRNRELLGDEDAWMCDECAAKREKGLI